MKILIKFIFHLSNSSLVTAWIKQHRNQVTASFGLNDGSQSDEVDFNLLDLAREDATRRLNATGGMRKYLTYAKRAPHPQASGQSSSRKRRQNSNDNSRRQHRHPQENVNEDQDENQPPPRKRTRLNDVPSPSDDEEFYMATRKDNKQQPAENVGYLSRSNPPAAGNRLSPIDSDE